MAEAGEKYLMHMEKNKSKLELLGSEWKGYWEVKGIEFTSAGDRQFRIPVVSLYPAGQVTGSTELLHEVEEMYRATQEGQEITLVRVNNVDPEALKTVPNKWFKVEELVIKGGRVLRPEWSNDRCTVEIGWTQDELRGEKDCHGISGIGANATKKTTFDYKNNTTKKA